jgi:hypothetical protein
MQTRASSKDNVQDDPDVVEFRRAWEERSGTLLPYIEMSVEPPEVEISDSDRLGGIEFLAAVLGSKPSQ